MDKTTIDRLLHLEKRVKEATINDENFRCINGSKFRIYARDFNIEIRKEYDSDKEDKELYDKIESIVGKYVHEKAIRLQNQFASIKIIDINDLK